MLLVILVGLAPIGVFASLIIVPPNVKWQPPMIWETQFGNATANGKNGITALAADKTGLYAVGFHGYVPPGTYYATTGFDFLKKFDFSGRELWSQQPDNLSLAELETVNVGPDGLYVSGVHWASNSTVFVGKYDFNGNVVWMKDFGSLSDYSPPGISVSTSGLYVAGLARGYESASRVPVIMRSYDLNGNVLWTESLSNETVFGPVLVFASSNGVYFAGSDEIPLRPVDTHAFIARYDTSGAQLWNRQFDTSPSFWCACVPGGLSGDSSGIYVSGAIYDNHFLNGVSPFLRKYDSNGNPVWATGQAGGKISVTQTGLYSLGRYLERYDPSDGNRVWSVQTQGRVADYTVGENGVYTGGNVFTSEGIKSLLVGYDQSASLVLGGVNPPYSFLILGSFPGAVAIAILLVRRSKARNLLHSEGELPDVKVSRQRQDAAGQWWVERQLARRAAEKWPGLNEEKDHDKDKAGSEDGKGSE